MTVAAVDRCLTILEALAGEREPIELTDLANRLDMPASAVHRTLTTLVSHGGCCSTVEPNAMRFRFA